MRIVFILRNIYPYQIGGVELTYYYLLPELQKFNIIPILISEFEESRFETWLIKNKWPNTLWFKLQVLKFLILNRNNYDMIHIPYMHTPSYFNWLIYPLINKFLKKPYVISIHGGRAEKWRPKFPHYLFFKYAKSISATANSLAIEYQNRSGRSIEVIPSQIPLTKSIKNKNDIFVEFKISALKKYVLVVGSLKHIKSPLTIVKAFSKLGIEYITQNNLHLLFVGDGPNHRDIVNLSKELCIDEFITILGNLEREKVKDLYSIAFIYVIASEFESFSKSLFEAILNEVPIINSNVEIFKSTFKEGIETLFFNYLDSTDLANKIIQLCDNSNLRKSLTENALRNFSNIFDYQNNIVKKYLELYKNDE